MAGLGVMAFASQAFAWAESWDAIRKAAQDVHTIQCDFVQTRTLKILNRPIVSRGTMAFRRPSDLRWEYTSPLQSVLLMRGGTAGRYIKRPEGWVTDSSAKLDAMKVVLSEINLWLAGDFNASKTFRPELHADPATATTVELVPIDPSLAKIISRIVLKLGAKPGSVDSIEIQEGAEGSTRIEFSNVRQNAQIPEERFAPVI